MRSVSAPVFAAATAAPIPATPPPTTRTSADMMVSRFFVTTPGALRPHEFVVIAARPAAAVPSIARKLLLPLMVVSLSFIGAGQLPPWTQFSQGLEHVPAEAAFIRGRRTRIDNTSLTSLSK